MDNKSFYQGCAGKINPLAIADFDYTKSDFIAEEKYDGIWIDMVFDAFGDVTLLSNTQKEKDNKQLESLREYAKNTLQLKNSRIQGELAFGSQTGTIFAKKHGHHKIDAFDILQLNGQLLDDLSVTARKGILHDILKKSDPLWVCEGWWKEIKTGQQVEKMYESVVERGGEGLIIKDTNDYNYKFGGKSKNWYKIKKYVTNDYVIMGYDESESADFRSRGWIGAILCGLYVGDELVQKVRIGSMTFEWREEISKNRDKYIGTVLEVGGNEIFKSGSMRHPFFVRMRDDKYPTACTWTD